MPVQTFSIHKTAAADNGIDFTANPGAFWTVGPSVLVASDLGDGVASIVLNSTLLNHGSIVSTSPSGNGVNFSLAANGTIYNYAEGSISGNNGIAIDSSHVDIVNLGSIVGTSNGVVFSQNSSNCSLDNRGVIYSTNIGVLGTSTSGGHEFVNSGTIEGDSIGIAFGAGAGDLSHFANSGTLRGGFAAIVEVTGALNLQNSGKVIGDISLGAPGENDTIANSGSISGTVHLGGGNDRFNGAGGSSGAVLGEAGVDTLTGGALADILDGGAGNDKLFGGAGSDRLTGGSNNDVFVFNTPLSVANRDTVTDFNHVNDTFQLENAIFTKLGAGVHALNPLFFHAGAAAADANDYIVYNKATGGLFYDSDGSGAQAAIQFATLANHATIAANDFQVI